MTGVPIAERRIAIGAVGHWVGELRNDAVYEPIWHVKFEFGLTSDARRNRYSFSGPVSAFLYVEWSAAGVLEAGALLDFQIAYFLYCKCPNVVNSLDR